LRSVLFTKLPRFANTFQQLIIPSAKSNLEEQVPIKIGNLHSRGELRSSRKPRAVISSVASDRRIYMSLDLAFLSRRHGFRMRIRISQCVLSCLIESGNSSTLISSSLYFRIDDEFLMNSFNVVSMEASFIFSWQSSRSSLFYCSL